MALSASSRIWNPPRRSFSKCRANGKNGAKGHDQEMLHLTLPDGKTDFDQCIERLHIIDESNDRHPITDHKWKAGEGASWMRWREYIVDRFAHGRDINDKNV